MIIPDNGIDLAKLEDYKFDKNYTKFIEWFNEHKNNIRTETSMLKNVLNTPENKQMISVYKRLRLKVYNGVPLRIKLQGRGTRLNFDYDANRSLRLGDSERFTVYMYPPH